MSVRSVLLALTLVTLAAFSSPLLGRASADHNPDSVRLVDGANLVVYNGPTLPVGEALGEMRESVRALWSFEAELQSWLLWSPALPESLQSLTMLEHGRAYFVIVDGPQVWHFERSAPLPEMPPKADLVVAGGERAATTMGSYCWPTGELGIGICADVLLAPFQEFHDVDDDLVHLIWDEPSPTTLTLQLLHADLSPTGRTKFVDSPSSEVVWTPLADEGEYVVAAFATWEGLGRGAASGDAVYYAPVRLSGQAFFEPVQMLAPIESVEITIAESFPPQYFVAITSGLPDSCAAFDRIETEREGTTIRITVWNTGPPPAALIACAQVYGTMDHNVALGSDFEPGEEYTVLVNGVERTFVAQ